MILLNNAKKFYDANLVVHTNKIFLVNTFKVGNNSEKVAALSPQPHLSCS